MARKPPRLNTAASICKAVAKYGLRAHIVSKPDGTVEFDIKKDASNAREETIQTDEEWD